MKVPKYIETAIIKAGKSARVNRDNSEIVRKWFEDNGLIDENGENLTEYNVIDYMIDSIECGIDGSNNLIDFIKEIEINR